MRLVRDPDVRFFTDEYRNPLDVTSLAAACLELVDRPEITGLLPGLEQPTVLPLAGQGDVVAIHAAAPEAAFWETVARLKAAGASSILALSVDALVA